MENSDTRKVQHLLAAFEAAKKPATYLALDISKASLEQNVSYLVSKHSGPDASVQCGGLWGTFGDGMAHVETIQSPRLFLSLGSVLCNDPWFEALSHLRSWARLMQPEDYLLIGMDGHLAPQDGQKIWDAYHSCDDLYKQFFLNGFRFSNELLEEEWFREEDWDLLAEMEEHPTTRHRFFFRSKRAVAIKSLNLTFEKGQELDWFDSHKYGEETVRLMASKAGLVVDKVWKAPGSEFRKFSPTFHECLVMLTYISHLGQYLVRTRQGKDDSSDGDSAVAGLD